MPPAVGMVAGAAATAYAANKTAKASQVSPTAGGNRPVITSGGSRVVGKYNPKGEWAYDLVTVDPRIRQLREMALGRIPTYRQGITDATGTLNSRLEGTRAELASNENPFIQARVNPLLARAAEGRGALSRSLVRRGLGGSSLYSSGLGNYDAAVGREIGDQRALATQEALDARTAMDQGIYNSALSALQAFQSLDSQEQAIAQQNLQQELASLGLSASDTSAALGAAGLQLQGAQLKNEAWGRGLDQLGRILSSMPSSKSSSFGSGSTWANEIGL